MEHIADAFAVMAGEKEIARLSSLGEANSYALEVHGSKRFLERIKQACAQRASAPTRRKRELWLEHIVQCRKNGLGKDGIHIRPIYIQREVTGV